MEKNVEGKHRSWCFTINNYTFNDIVALSKLNYKYIIVGAEVGDCGTKHLQGYVNFSEGKQFSVLQKALHNKAHLELPGGNADHNYNYCSKDGDFFEDGKRPSPGKRTDLQRTIEDINNRLTLRETAIKNPEVYIKYHNGVTKYHTLINRPKGNREIKTHIRWGDAGKGKTRYIWDNNSYEDIFPVNLEDSFPFDGYNGEKIIIIDDFSGDYPITILLRWLDRYPVKVNTKGGFAWANWETIYITANTNPDSWFPNSNKKHKEAFRRRVTDVTEVGGNTKPPPVIDLEDNI